MSMYCKYCGNPIPDGNRVCETCGAPAPVMFSAGQPSSPPATQPWPGMQQPGQPQNGAPQFSAASERGSEVWYLTRTMSRAAEIAAGLTDIWSYWDDIEIDRIFRTHSGKRFYIRSAKDVKKFCAREDKRMHCGTDYICIVSPDGAIGLTGTDVEDPDDPGSIDWVYVTKAREYDDLPGNIEGLNIVYM